MSFIDDAFTEQFARWERRGRGTILYDAPVSPDPPFLPFSGYWLPRRNVRDEGRRHTPFSGLLERLTQAGAPQPPALPEYEDVEPEPNWCGEEEMTELRAILPPDFAPRAETVADFLASVSLLHHPMVFEIVGDSERVISQFSVSTADVSTLEAQLHAHFTDAQFLRTNTALRDAWQSENDMELAVIEIALGREFILPLAETRADIFVGMVGALSNLAPGECGVYQVTFAPVTAPWAEHSANAIMDDEGKPVFVNRTDLLKAAAHKFALPLYGTVVRLAARSVDLDRVWSIIRAMAAPLRQFSNHNGNALMPVTNAGYDPFDHERDLLCRQSRRSGMILNLAELLGFVHLPSAGVKSQKFVRIDGTSRGAPNLESPEGVCLGINQHLGQSVEVRLTNEQRVRHMHIMGGTGTGKSTLLFNLIQQDIERNEGLAVLDPHGDLIDRVLGIIPQERINDVVLIDPSDEEFIVPFNILSAHSEFEKMLLASDLVSVFARWSTTWGDQMNSVFRQAVVAFLESSEGGTLSDLRRFLVDSSWRERFLQTVLDADVRFYWKCTFPQLGANKSIGPILTRLEMLLSPKPLRLMLSQRENKLDFADMMDSGKILLAKLPQGLIGRENAFILGSLLVSKLQETAMSRQRLDARKRRPFFCYIDEFQNFICPSMAEILSAARKYSVALILAHQELHQIDRDPDVKSAVLANAFTRVVFRVSDSDARTLSEGFAHFEPRELQSLKIGEAICRIERADNDFNLAIPQPAEIDETATQDRRAEVTAASRAQYATPRRQVEAELLRQFEEEEASVAPKPQRPKAQLAQAVDAALDAQKTERVHIKINEEALPKDASPSECTVEEPPKAEASPQPEAELPPAVPAEQGKGGYQHRIVQDRIKAVAEKRGFRVTLEMPIGQGRESIDVGMLRSDIRIACEISVTTTIDHEVGNVRKCLRGGFDVVAVVTANERRLKQIEAAVKGSLAPEDSARVQYFSPDQFVDHVAGLAEPPPDTPSAPKPTETVRKGWKVKRAYKLLTPEERAAKEAAAFRLLSEEMKKPGE